MKTGETRTMQAQPAGAAAPLRVIAVGRSGLESALRVLPGAELIRARTGLEAIGELAEPAAAGAASVVVVGRDAHADTGASGGNDASLAAALRRVDPGVRILSTGDEERDAGVFDGAVNAGEAGGALLAALCTEPVSSAATPACAQTGGSVEAAAADDGPVHAGAGDESLVRALLRGEDVLPAAVRLLGGRTAAACRYVGATPGASAPANSVAVRWRDALLGWLVFDGEPPADAASHARWLGGWLALREQHAQLSEAAFTDPLTGAWSRRYFDRFLAAAIEQARPQRGTVTVLFFDIDDFKRFNDEHGHGAGDEILRETVALLRSVIRPGDKVCRIGGDEFAVIFHQPEGPRDPASKPPETVCAIAERFQNQVRLQRFPKLGLDAPGTLTISGGLATYPWDGRTPEELLRRADELAIQCKRQGKNAIIFGPGAAGV